MLQTFKNGQGSVVLRCKLLNSSATNGDGLTGLTSISSGLRISTIADNEATATAYTVAGSTIETITTLGTYAAPTATKCRFKELDATNHPGIYELHLADSRLAVANAKSLIVSFSGATNLAQADFVVQLQSDDPYVAKPANSSLLSIDASGRVDVAKVAGTAQTARDIGASVLISSGTGTGQLSVTSGVVSANTTQLAGQSVTAAAGVTFPSSVASPTNITAASGVALTSAYDFAKGTTAMTESYAADGAAATPVQILHQLWALAAEKNISSTTLTAKKLDGSTTAMTFTLNDASTPTSITRTT